jgi:type III pantothenate kinase
MNCLVVDIGNTSTAVGLALDGRISGVCHLHGGLKDRRAIRLVLDGLVGPGRPDGAVLCSVVPAANPVWIRMLEQAAGTPPLIVTHRLRLGVRVLYPRPWTIGADRLANASAAVARYGAPVIVADFGTALTFDIVSREGAYIGGVIVPGLPLMTDYLAERTALLPRIRPGGRIGRIGRSTAGAMRLGARIGYRGMVREILGYLQDGLNLRGARLCATGGYAGWALAGSDMPFVIAPDLTLFGLSRIFELNRRQTGCGPRARRVRVGHPHPGPLPQGEREQGRLGRNRGRRRT